MEKKILFDAMVDVQANVCPEKVDVVSVKRFAGKFEKPEEGGVPSAVIEIVFGNPEDGVGGSDQVESVVGMAEIANVVGQDAGFEEAVIVDARLDQVHGAGIVGAMD